MPRSLPTRPDLAQLKRQAKELLTAFYTGDTTVQQLFSQHLHGFGRNNAGRRPQRILLAHALVVLAREYGFASWPKLKHHVESTARAQLKHPTPSGGESTRQQRKQAYQQHIAQIAEQLVTAARLHEFDRLFAAFKIPGRDSIAVRAYLVEHGMYDAVIDALLISAEHTNARMRFWSVQAMDHFADERCGGLLRRLLHDPVPRVRWAALHSLQCAECKLAPLAPEGDTVATIVDLALHDPSIKVRRVATYELGQVCADDPRAVATLEAIHAQATDRAILRAARQALKRYQQAAGLQQGNARIPVSNE